MGRANHLIVGLLSGITIGIFCAGNLFGQEVKMTDKELSESILHISRIAAKKPFLKDSSDVLLEKQSLNRFFTDRIYEKLEGNAYFGYKFDEGFTCAKHEIFIDEIKDLTKTVGDAYRFALEQALFEYQIKPEAVCRIGVAIVGIEAEETKDTLAGVMTEAYLLNTATKKSFFYRYGAGNPRGLAAALRLSAEMLIAELEGRYESESNIK
jgi:hypothetical protein